MRPLNPLLVIVTLPAIVALAHDLWLFYDNQDTIDEFKFAALGFIWTQYSPESYKWMAENMGEAYWDLVKTFLTFKAFFTCLVFAGFFYVLALVKKLVVVLIGGEKFAPKKDTKFHRGSHDAKGQKYSYKRK